MSMRVEKRGDAYYALVDMDTGQEIMAAEDWSEFHHAAMKMRQNMDQEILDLQAKRDRLVSRKHHIAIAFSKGVTHI